MPAVRRLAPLAANVALAATSTVATLAVAEGVCRLFDHAPAPRPAAAYITVWNDGEFFTVNSAATGWPPWEDYNRDGVRDREHATEKPAGRRRIMCLGDSVTLGYGLRPQEAYPQVLQDVLDARGTPVEVFNVAFSGWSTRQERIAYDRICRKYRPDQLVLGVCLNDIPEIYNNLSRPPALFRFLHARSALVRTVVGARRREIRDVEELFTDPSSPSVRAAMAAFFDEVRVLSRAARGDGAALGLVVLPFRMQLEPQAPPPAVQEEIVRFCATEGLPCLDLLPALRPLGGDAFLDYDHLSAAGARRVAEAIADSAWVAPEGGPSRGTTAAGRALSAAGSPAAKASSSPSALLDRLRDPDAAVRAAAARALGNSASEPSAVPALVRALDDTDPDVRAAAIWSLGGFGAAAAPGVSGLTAALDDARPHARAGAAWALGKIGAAARQAAPALARRLADASEDVRWRAADALAGVDAEPADLVPILLPLIADPACAGRAGAAAALGRLGPAARPAVAALASALADPRDDVRAKAAWALGEVGPEAKAGVPALVGVIATPGVGWHAIDALGNIGAEARAAVPVLRSALADSSGNVRWRAAAALGRIGGDARPATPELVHALRDPADNVRLAAARSLGQVGALAAESTAPLVRALADPDRRVRMEAASSLSRLEGIRASDAAKPLATGLHDPDPLVRSSATRALGRLERTPEVLSALAAAAKDTDPMVRGEAAHALKARRGSR